MYFRAGTGECYSPGKVRPDGRGSFGGSAFIFLAQRVRFDASESVYEG